MTLERALLKPDYFTQTRYFDLEQQYLFAATWQFAGFTMDLAENGQYVTLNVGTIPIVVQNIKGTLRAFHNVCPHRNAVLIAKPRGKGPLMCGYHGWMFNQHGRLCHVPGMTDWYGMTKDQQADIGLTAVRVETCGKLVFVCLKQEAADLQTQLGEWYPRYEQWSGFFANTYASTQMIANCNWKLLVHNLFDTTHAPWVHPQTFDTGMFADATRRQYPFNAETTDVDFPAQYAHRHFELNVELTPEAVPTVMAQHANLYPLPQPYIPSYLHAFIYPNQVFVSYLGFWFSVARYEPISPTQTRIINTLVPGIQPHNAREPLTPDFALSHMQSSVRVYHEDFAVCETVQQGLSSAMHQPSYFGKDEAPMRHFEEAYRHWLEAIETQVDQADCRPLAYH
jgi:phenylpropionate dioxygenase-like ring-hydroxylating dioxygenase large terminal subunit